MSIVSLDQQFDFLPSEVSFCTNCVVSNQRPQITFDERGVCSACQWSLEKDNSVDWDNREKELEELGEKYRSRTGKFDCVVPGSGGKDSAFVAHQLRHRWGMNPLCVTFAPFDWTPAGWRNLNNFAQTGNLNLICQSDGVLQRKLANLAFEAKGDAFEPFAFGQKGYAYNIAVQYGIKLIFYGENGSLEYSGLGSHKDKSHEATEEWAENYYKGSSFEDLVRLGIEKGSLEKNLLTDERLRFYTPPLEQANDLGVEMHWYSYYQKWIPQENFYYAARHTGFETNDEGRTSGTYTKYASFDDRTDDFHFFMGLAKFGMGRASRDAQQDIRRHHLTRDEGARLVQLYDQEFPEKNFRWFLAYLDITEDYFWEVVHFYMGRSNVWKKEYGKWILKQVVS